jgi:Domain of unknown function (DUF4032)/Lipopolysaccharide kinase (Kdo/WaaP) family
MLTRAVRRLVRQTRGVRLQLANPSLHPRVATLPFTTPLAEWDLPHMHGVLGLHRHVVRLIELGDASYVLKELPDALALREHRLLRELADDGLPTAEVVAVLTGRPDGADGILVTRHLDYSLPYRSLLSGRGLRIPYLGERLLDALVSLLVRLHLAGFYWGDCSLSNTLFRRDAGRLSAYVIDVETGERFPSLSDGQRALDLEIATENVAGGLLDLQIGGRLTADVDPWEVSLAIEDRYTRLWNELTSTDEFESGETFRVEQRLQRLHELGFDVEEVEINADDDGTRLHFIPRVVEHGYHAERLRGLTGLEAGEHQARRMLNDIRGFQAELEAENGKSMTPNVAAVRWLDRRFEPIMARIPAEMFEKLEAAEIYHQLLEHRWFLSEQAGKDVSLEDALESYLADVLRDAPEEKLSLDQPTQEIPVITSDAPADAEA